MKKIYNIISLILIGVIAFSTTGCDDDRESLTFSHNVKILSFKANGVDAKIDEQAQTIEVILPWSHDLKAIKTEVTVSEGATVTPANETNANLMNGQKYRIINGNTYHDYNAVAMYSTIRSFSIGKYTGLIDNENGTITVKYPIGEDLTALIPTFTVSEGATVSPESGKTQDFIDPVTYTISYMGESFDYTVTVIPTNFKLIGFIGTAAKANQITDADEKAAYEWFSENVPVNQYISFTDIKEGNVNLHDFYGIWWHLDGDQSDLPAISRDPSVISKLKTYYSNGGSFFLSSWATQYASILDIPKNGKIINNMWGQGNTPFVAGEDWGICFTGNEAHPIFAGLQKPVGVNNKVFLLGKGTKAKGHNAIWSFDGWTEYPFDPDRWSTETGAINLASFHWDDSARERAVLFEYPKDGRSGCTICIGTEAYDWYNEDESIPNIYKDNLMLLTDNILNYIIN